MKRRTYIPKSRKELESDVLESMRQVRQQIDPEILQRAKQLVSDMGPAKGRQAFEDMLEKIPESKQDGEQGNDAHVPVDRKKNLTIVMKFLEKNPENQAVMNEIKILLTEDHLLSRH